MVAFDFILTKNYMETNKRRTSLSDKGRSLNDCITCYSYMFKSCVKVVTIIRVLEQGIHCIR